MVTTLKPPPLPFPPVPILFHHTHVEPMPLLFSRCLTSGFVHFPCNLFSFPLPTPRGEIPHAKRPFRMVPMSPVPLDIEGFRSFTAHPPFNPFFFLFLFGLVPVCPRRNRPPRFPFPPESSLPRPSLPLLFPLPPGIPQSKQIFPRFLNSP